jgi:hypothetical protein
MTESPRYQSPLRDLVLQLDRTAMAHPAYPQAAAAMNHLRDHLSALARCEEVNREAGAPDADVYRR